MVEWFRTFPVSRRLRSAGLAVAAVGAALVSGSTATQTAVANGDTRTLSLYHAHTQESITVTFRRNGSYDSAALEKLNWFLRDWRKDEPINMDPRLFDVVWATQKDAGSDATIRVVSAYRSPSTNAMLRRRSSAVAKHSQHTLGKAMDFHVPDVSMSKIREMGMRLQRGGVGYYPTAGTPFVHLDVGSVRSWPRMPRPQLERLFPDGKTVHLPADGTPLAGYETALAEIQSRGGYADSYAEASRPSRSLWAALFGGEDDEAEVATPRGRNGKQVATRGRNSAAPQQVAYAAPSGDSASVYAIGGAAPAPVQEQLRPTVTVARPRPAPVEDKPAAEAPKAPVAVAALTPPPPPSMKEAKPADDEDEKPISKAVSVPLPPRRPSDLTALALANVPLPPVRPDTSGWAAEDAPKETTRIAEVTLKPVNMPAPVPRPVAFAGTTATISAVERNALPAAITAGVAVPDAPSQKLALASAPAPRPVPAPASRAAAPRPEAPPEKFGMKMDAAAMKSLIAGIASANDRPEQIEKVAAPSVKRSVGSVVVAGKFGETGTIAESGRFTGSMVRPLTAGFVKKGE